MGKDLNKAVNQLAYSNEYLLYRTLHIKHLKYTQYEASLNRFKQLSYRDILWLYTIK